jgi:hypothetical protein
MKLLSVPCEKTWLSGVKAVDVYESISKTNKPYSPMCRLLWVHAENGWVAQIS